MTRTWHHVLDTDHDHTWLGIRCLFFNLGWVPEFKRLHSIQSHGNLSPVLHSRIKMRRFKDSLISHRAVQLRLSSCILLSAALCILFLFSMEWVPDHPRSPGSVPPLTDSTSLPCQSFVLFFLKLTCNRIHS